MSSAAETKDVKGYSSGAGKVWASEQIGNTFHATNEWQEIQPGQQVPPGLKINLDIATGKRFAKLIPKNVKIVEDLTYITEQIESGVAVDARDATGTTLLHRAVDKGALDCVEFLVGAKADPNMMGKGARFSALHSAIQRGHTGVVQFLVTKGKANVKQASKSGNYPLHLAATKGQAEIGAFLLTQKQVGINNKNKEGDTALHLAAQGGHGSFVALLIDNRANVELTNAEGKVPSEVAEDYEHEEVANTIKSVLSERALDALMNELGVDESDKTTKKKKKPKFKPVKNGEEGNTKKNKKNKNKKNKNKKNKKNDDDDLDNFTPSGGGGGGGGGGGLAISDNQPSTGGGLVISDVQPVRSTRPEPKEEESESEDDEVDLCDLDDDLD